MAKPKDVSYTPPRGCSNPNQSLCVCICRVQQGEEETIRPPLSGPEKACDQAATERLAGESDRKDAAAVAESKKCSPSQRKAARSKRDVTRDREGWERARTLERELNESRATTRALQRQLSEQAKAVEEVQRLARKAFKRTEDTKALKSQVKTLKVSELPQSAIAWPYVGPERTSVEARIVLHMQLLS